VPDPKAKTFISGHCFQYFAIKLYLDHICKPHLFTASVCQLIRTWRCPLKL